MKRRVIEFFVLFFLLVFLLAAVQLLRFGSFTGFIIFQDVTGGDFANGTYSYTEWNGSAVVLSSGQTSGTYTSQIFDAGDDSTWHNLSWSGGEPAIELLFAVDGAADVWNSFDLGTTWNLVKDDYNGGNPNGATYMDRNSSSDLFILHNQDIWTSPDSGTTWGLVNDDYNGAEGQNGYVLGIDNSDNFVIIEGDQDVWKSTDFGVSWTKVATNFNGGNGDIFGITVDSFNVIFAVDGAADVWNSFDLGTTWNLVKDDYNGGNPNGATYMARNSSGDLFILHNQDIWTSPDSGTTWGLINDDYNGVGDSNNGKVIYADSNDNLYIADGSEDVYKSADAGLTWTSVASNMNGGNGEIFGSVAITKQTDLTFQVRNCSSANCADGTWQAVDLSNLNLVSQYFQYKISFMTPDSGTSPLIESVTIDYDLVNTAPNVNLFEPQDGGSYGYNESLSLDFSTYDADGNIESCWYNIDWGADVLIVGCVNTTFDISEGSHTLVVFVNDTLGLESNASASFSVVIGAPTISLSSPIGTYSNSGDVTFRYTPIDIDLNVCELWGDFDGVFSLNSTDYSPASGVENVFSLNLNDGTYKWNIVCNDTLGNSATNGNKTFYIDRVAPSLSLTEPSGSKSSRTGIGLTFSVNDSSPVSCLYNIYQGASVEIANTSVACSLGSSSFDVSADANYVLNFYVNDSAGNSNSSSSSFSVSTSSEDTGGDGGGGTGGGGGVILQTPEEGQPSKVLIGFSDMEEMILKRGSSSDVLSVEIVNNEKRFLNDCELEGNGNLAGWVESEQVRGLSAGEKFEFNFKINVPSDSAFGTYNDGIVIKCSEGQAVKQFRITIYRNPFESKINDYERIGGMLRVNYNLEEYSGSSHDILIEYKLVDFDGVERMIGSESVQLGASETKDYVLEFDLPKDSFGEFKLEFKFSDGSVEFTDSKDIFLPSTGITGLTISESNKKTLSVTGVILLILIAGFFIFKYWWKKKHKFSLAHSFGQKIKRKMIKLEL